MWWTPGTGPRDVYVCPSPRRSRVLATMIAPWKRVSDDSPPSCLATFAVLVAHCRGRCLLVLLARLVRRLHRSRGPGFYLNLFKFIPFVIYLLWTWTRTGSTNDTKIAMTHVRLGMSSLLLGCGRPSGLWPIPIFSLSLILSCCLFVPLFSYIYARNQTVPADDRVLDGYTTSARSSNARMKMGIRQSSRQATSRRRPPVPVRFMSAARAQTRRRDPIASAEPSRSRSWRPRSWSTTPSSAGRPTSTSSRPRSSSRSATGSTASSTPPSRSTGPPATP